MRSDFMGNKQLFLHHPIGRKTMKEAFFGKKQNPMLYNNYMVHDVYMKPREVREFGDMYYHAFA